MHATEERDPHIKTWVLIVLAISLGLRVGGLEAQSIWRDEADSLRFAASPALLGQMFTTPGHNAPLYYLLLRGWLRLSGPGLASARLLSALCGTLAVALVYALGRRLFSHRVGALAALCAGASPYLVWYAQEARTYALVSAVGLLSLWLYLRALERGGAYWAGYLFAAATCIYLHLMTALLILAQMAIGLAWPVGRWSWRRAAPILGAAVALGAPVLWWAGRFLASPPAGGLAPITAGQILSGLVTAFTTGPTGRLPLALIAPGLFLVLAGATLPPREPARRILLLWLLVPPAGMILLTFLTPLFTERYLIFIAPAFYLLAARGALRLGALWKPLTWLSLGALLAIQAAGLGVQYTQTIKPDFRAATAYYERARQPGDRVLFLIPQAAVVFEQLLPADSTPYLAAPYANAERDAARLDWEMRALLGESRRVWLLESEPELWDAGGRIAAWLERHGQRVLRIPYHLVTLSLYADLRVGERPPHGLSWPLVIQRNPRLTTP